MKITIYELLGMIKDGKAPKRIIFDTEIYNWCEEQEEYRRYPYNNEIYKNLNSDYYISKCLNDTVEILEEEKKIPEKIPEEIIVGKKQPTHRIKKIEKKINEIISYLDYLKSKGE